MSVFFKALKFFECFIIDQKPFDFNMVHQYNLPPLLAEEIFVLSLYHHYNINKRRLKYEREKIGCFPLYQTVHYPIKRKGVVNMKIGIVGGGSVGLLIGSYLSKKYDVTIYVRRLQQKKQLEQHGLQLANTSSTSFVKSKLLEDMVEMDVLFICVKQYHLTDVIPIVNQTNEQTPLFFLQNGMGHIDTVKTLGQPIFIGVVEHGALRQNDYTVSHTGRGIIKLASLRETDQVQRFVQAFHQTEFPFQVAADWEALLLEKLVINAVINPLTALFNVPNGDLLKNEYLRILAKQLCHETAKTFHLDDVQEWKRIKEVAINTKENISSMLKDVRERRPTEIEAILGYIRKQHSSPEHIPFISFAYNGIKALEVKNTSNDVQSIELHDTNMYD